MKNARKKKLEWCKLLPKHGVARKRWLRGLNHKEIRWWVFQRRIHSPTQRRLGEIMREVVLDMTTWCDPLTADHAWLLFNGYFTKSKRQREWMEALLKRLESTDA